MIRPDAEEKGEMPSVLSIIQPPVLLIALLINQPAR